jgi:hypothetical protein
MAKKKKVIGTPFTSETAKEAGKKSKRGPSVLTLLEKYGSHKLRGQKQTYKEAIIARLVKNAFDPEQDIRWLREYLDRLEGKPLQKVDAKVEETKIAYVPEDAEGL